MEKCFWSASKKWSKHIDNIWKSAIGHEDYYTAGCLLYYPYFKENYKLIAIDLSRQ